eukprot:3766094-Alexandrium_andersonii.AAC.1
MSASLVGSEMCIRDRRSRGLLALLGLVQQPLGRSTPRPVQTSKKRVKPVSYTHLTLPTICSV